MPEVDFTPPLRASRHCRHYSYVTPMSRRDAGPNCAQGCSFETAGSTGRCMPEPSGPCDQREEYTDEERAAWEEARTANMVRLAKAVAALPAPIPLRSGGTIECPNCGGELRYDRWHRGASVQCSTPFCCGAHFSIPAGADWPDRKDKR